MRRVFSLLAGMALVRLLARALLTIAGWAAGGASRVRTAALFPDSLERDTYVYWNARIKYADKIKAGKGLRVGSECVLGALGGIELGDHVRISKGAIIETGGLDLTGTPPYSHVAKPIRVGDGVWIGTNAIVLGGVCIGAGAVVAAGSVVTRNVPENAVVGGNPARVIKIRSTLER
jgi:maltose O-acetyltransferase